MEGQEVRDRQIPGPVLMSPSVAGPSPSLLPLRDVAHMQGHAHTLEHAGKYRKNSKTLQTSERKRRRS